MPLAPTRGLMTLVPHRATYEMKLSVARPNSGIVEVNAAPGFRMHTHPTEGEPQYVAKPVIDLLFPVGSNARIPIIGVTGTNGKTTTAYLLAQAADAVGRTLPPKTSRYTPPKAKKR